MKKISFLLTAIIFMNINCQFKIETTSFETCEILNTCSTENVLDEGFFTKFGTLIPKKFTCDGIDVSPELTWNSEPSGTKSYVLIVEDPDAIPVVGFTFIHWFVLNIPANIHKLNVNQSFSTPVFKNTVQLKNDFGFAKYGGPCPPAGDKVHHYKFTLFALNVNEIILDQAITAQQFNAKFAKNILGCTRLIGLYQR